VRRNARVAPLWTLVSCLSSLVWCGSSYAVTVSSDEIRAAAEAHVRARLPPGVTDVRFDFHVAPAPVTLPSASARCEVARRVPILWNGPFGLPVRVVGDRGEEKIQALSLSVSGEAHPLVTLRSIEAGAFVMPADVTRAARSLSQTPPQTRFDVSELAGQTAVHKIPAGAVLQRSHLTSPLLVRTGETVSLFARRGALLVETPGKALSSGRLGDAIRVRNAATGATVEGRVAGERRVEALGEAALSSRP
jgi:flagella basal body P-ring formation protein FlgA